MKGIHQKWWEEGHNSGGCVHFLFSLSYTLNFLQGINIVIIKNKRYFCLKSKWMNWVISKVSLAIFYITLVHFCKAMPAWPVSLLAELNLLLFLVTLTRYLRKETYERKPLFGWQFKKGYKPSWWAYVEAGAWGILVTLCGQSGSRWDLAFWYILGYNPGRSHPHWERDFSTQPNFSGLLHKHIQKFVPCIILFPIKLTVENNYQRIHFIFKLHERNHLSILWTTTTSKF